MDSNAGRRFERDGVLVAQLTSAVDPVRVGRGGLRGFIAMFVLSASGQTMRYVEALDGAGELTRVE